MCNKTGLSFVAKWQLLIGSTFLCFAILCNEWTISVWVSSDGNIAGTNLVVIRFVMTSLIVWGLLSVFLRRSRFIARINVSLVCFVLCLVAVEFYLRHQEMDEAMMVKERQRLRSADAFLHHRLNPLQEGKLQWGARVVHYAINSAGMRDESCRQIEKTLPTGKRRLLVLGDSFAEGTGVEYHESVSAGISQYLEDGSIDVLNGGVASYSPKLQYRWLKRLLDDGYRVNNVILFFDNSDVHDEGVLYRDWEGYSRLQLQGFEEKRKEQLLSAQQTDKRHRIYHLLYPRILEYAWQLIRAVRMGDPFLSMLTGEPRYLWTELSESPVWVEEGLASCCSNILNISNLCKKHHIQFTLVIYPHPVQLLNPESPSRAEVLMEQFATSQNIPFVNLYPVFRDESNWRGLFIPGDIHWNAAGHDLVARSVVDAWKPDNHGMPVE